MRKTFKYISLAIILLIGLYLSLALILQSILVGETKIQKAGKFQAYVSSGDIHTEFVFPVSNALFDWRELVPINLVTNKILDPKYISIGWGSRDFFFNMKTWDEIKWGVILKAIFLPGESVLHVEYLKDLNDSPKLYPLYLTKDEYLKLISFIKNYFVLDDKGHVQRVSEFSYYETDKFFKSHHHYHMLNTCNMWTQKGLESINAKRPIWAPFKYGIENAMLSK